jgi:hypothetical protein
MQIKNCVALLFMSGVLLCQRPENLTIRSETVDPGKPLHSPTCKDSTFGDLHIGERTKLSAMELGQYILDATAGGSILTV